MQLKRVIIYIQGMTSIEIIIRRDIFLTARRDIRKILKDIYKIASFINLTPAS